MDVHSLRRQFPALNRTIHGTTPIFLDGPGGTQVPQSVINAMVAYLSTCNSNCGGAFTTSSESDTILDGARQAVADLFNARSPKEVVFGPNMTSLTFQLSRALGRTWKPGDAVVVTRLDHDANVRPWALAARDAGAEVRFVDFDPVSCTLDFDDLQRKLDPSVRLVAVTCASNAVGTIPDVRAVIQKAKSVGALVFLDAVHYAAHGPIDVQAWGCDFLACSAYKFFGPHVGLLWGREELLAGLTAYKVRPCTDELPVKWMTGTQNHEGIAGVHAAVDYLASLGEGDNRRSRLLAAWETIRAHETALVRRFLQGLAERPRFRVWGLTAEADLARRTPTVSITANDVSPADVARHLASREVYVWSGNFYALELTERLGVESRGGLVRLGLVHYNTEEEVERTLRVLDEL
jgi:cysteine desulfurase family protein (TIGR01976 family)